MWTPQIPPTRTIPFPNIVKPLSEFSSAEPHRTVISTTALSAKNTRSRSWERGLRFDLRLAECDWLPPGLSSPEWSEMCAFPSFTNFAEHAVRKSGTAPPVGGAVETSVSPKGRCYCEKPAVSSLTPGVSLTSSSKKSKYAVLQQPSQTYFDERTARRGGSAKGE
jgi:hypothetical protein